MFDYSYKPRRSYELLKRIDEFYYYQHDANLSFDDHSRRVDSAISL